MTTDEHDVAYTEGYRMALRVHLHVSLKQLGYDDPEGKAAQWILEREAIIGQLRTLCAAFGDNDWDEHLHLADVVEKHLGRYLHERLDV